MTACFLVWNGIVNATYLKMKILIYMYLTYMTVYLYCQYFPVIWLFTVARSAVAVLLLKIHRIYGNGKSMVL